MEEQQERNTRINSCSRREQCTRIEQKTAKKRCKHKRGKWQKSALKDSNQCNATTQPENDSKEEAGKLDSHLNVRQNHLVGVQAGANRVGLGVLHESEHNLAGPGQSEVSGSDFGSLGQRTSVASVP
jgi:hypothetical protein